MRALEANLVAIVLHSRMTLAVLGSLPFADDALLRQTDAQPYGFALMAHRVFGRNRPVGAPAATQPSVVGVFKRVLDVDDACGKTRSCLPEG